MLRNLVRTLAVLALPVGCILLARHFAGDGAALLGDKPFGLLCNLQTLDRGAGAETECRAADWLWLFHRFAWITLAAGLVPILLFASAAAFCGTSRRRTVAVFPALVPTAVFLVVANLLMQGALLLMAMIAIYIAWIGNPPIGALIAAGVGIFGTAGAVVAGTAGLSVSPVVQARADAVTRKQAPNLWATIEGLATKLGADPPDHIVIGLEPNFWVVAGIVDLTGEGLSGRLRGRTMHLSLPLMHVLAPDEFAAVVGHELGHFIGRDSEYSRRFLPLFVTIEHARFQIDAPDSGPKVRAPLVILLLALSRIPARALLSMLGTAFRRNVRRIGRLREFAADAAGARAGGARALATALFKLPLHARLWSDVLADHAARIAIGKPPAPQLAAHFDDLARLVVTPDSAKALRELALRARATHPYDTHPPTFERVKALGLAPADISAAELRVREGDGVAATLLPERLRDALEGALAMAENQALRDAGEVPDKPIPFRKPKVAPLYHAVYSILSALVRIAPDPALRFLAAVRAGNAEMTEFDRAIFAEYCRARRTGLAVDEALDEVMEIAGPDGVSSLGEMAEATFAEGGPEGPDDAAVRAWLARNVADLTAEG